MYVVGNVWFVNLRSGDGVSVVGVGAVVREGVVRV